MFDGCSIVISGMLDTLACTVCMGSRGGLLAEAANGAIFLMLGILFVVFSGFIAGGMILVRRGRRPLPEHYQLLNSIDNKK